MTIVHHLVPIGPSFTDPSARFFSSRRRIEKEKRGKGRERKGREGKGKERGSLLHRGSAFSLPSSSFPSCFPLSQHAPRDPLPSPLQSASSIFMPRMAFLAENFPPVVQNGLHYHNLSDGTPTPPRGLGGFNVIINQNPR